MNRKYYYPGLEEKITIVYLESEQIGYTSPELKEYFRYNIIMSPYIPSQFKTIMQKDLAKGEIIPFYSTSSLVSEIFATIFDRFFGETIYGFCYKGKIFLPIVKYRSVFGSIDIKELASTLLHEYGHKLAFDQNIKNNSKVKKYLNLWFTEFFNGYFKANNITLTQSDIDELLNIFANIGQEYKANSHNINIYIEKKLTKIQLLIQKWQKTDPQKADVLKNIYNMLEAVYLESNIYKALDHDYTNIYRNALIAYKKIMNKTTKSYIFQEFMFPSEVLCILQGEGGIFFV